MPTLQPPPTGACCQTAERHVWCSCYHSSGSPPGSPSPRSLPLPSAPTPAPPNEGRALCSRGPVHSRPARRLGHRLTVIADNQNRLLCPELPQSASGRRMCVSRSTAPPGGGAEARAASSGKSRVPSTREQRLYQTHLHHRFLLSLWILNTLYTVSKTSHSLISIH